MAIAVLQYARVQLRGDGVTAGLTVDLREPYSVITVTNGLDLQVPLARLRDLTTVTILSGGADFVSEDHGEITLTFAEVIPEDEVRQVTMLLSFSP